MVEGSIFIGAVVIALTQILKYYVPKVHGGLTIIAAALLGVLVGLIDHLIGVTDVSVAQGLMIGLAAVGTVTTAQSVASHTPPKGV